MTPAERIRKTCLPVAMAAPYGSLEAKLNAWRAANPEIVEAWAHWLTCPGHAANPKAPKAIGKMIDKRGKGKDESYEIQSIIGGTEDKWVVLDMDGTIRHPHSKAWALGLYASEHPFGCPGDECNPANDNKQMQFYSDALAAQLTAQMAAALNKLREVVEPARLDVMRRLLVLQDTCYGLANNAGWWQDLETGVDVRSWPKVHLDNWISAKLMLTVTEVAEAMEGHRKGLMDTHLTHRTMLEVELADAVIRIMDLAGGMNMDVAGAIVEKLAYNMTREDHQIENRKATGGKAI